MRSIRIWSILLSFVLLWNTVGYSQPDGEQSLLSLIGLDLSKKEEIGFMFSQEKIDIGYAKSYPLKYFFTALVVPSNELWVNLCPGLSDMEIIGKGLSNTDLGRLMLYYDVRLKEDVERLLILNADVVEEYVKGLECLPTLRFWIEPGTVEMEVDREGEKGVIRSVPLKVRVEVKGEKEKRLERWMRDNIIPTLERWVNKGHDYERLRQAYNSMVLAQWYKMHVRKGMAFSEYVDTNAKGKGIISSGVWFRSAYLKQYLKMYFRSNPEGWEWLPIVVGGMRGEIGKIKEIPVQLSNVRSEIRIRDVRDQMIKKARELKSEIEKLKGGITSLKEKKILEAFYTNVIGQNVKPVDGNVDLLSLRNEGINKGPRTVECEGSRFKVIPFDMKRELIILKNPTDSQSWRKAVNLFLSGLEKGKDIRLVVFLSEDLVKESITYGMPITLDYLFALYNKERDRIILLKESKAEIEGESEFVSAVNTLPSLAVLGGRMILVGGGIGVIGGNVTIGDVAKNEYEMLRFFEIDGYCLLRVENGRVVISKQSGEGEYKEADEKVISTTEGRVKFIGDSLDRIIEALRGENKRSHTYIGIDRDEKGVPIVFLYDAENSRPMSLDSSVMEVTKDGIVPGFLYSDWGKEIIRGILPPINGVTLQMLPTIRRAIDVEMRNRYCGDKEKIVNNAGIKGVREVRLRGMSEEEWKKEVKEILEYKGKRDLYVWIRPVEEEKYDLIFQPYRPLVYSEEEQRWGLLRLNHRTAWVDVVRQEELPAGVVFNVVSAIKRRFIHFKDSSPSVWIGLNKVGKEGIWEEGKKGKWVVGKEFYLPYGARVQIKKMMESDMEERIVTLFWRDDRLVLSVEKEILSLGRTISSEVMREVEISKSERVFLNSKLEVVQSPDQASFIIELGEDSFIRVIGLKKEGVLMVVRTETNLVEVKEGDSKVIRYKGKDYRDREVELINDGENFIVKRGEREVIEIKKPSFGRSVLVDDDFQMTSEGKKVRFRVSFEKDKVLVEAIGDTVWIPVVHMRDIMYEDREDIHMSSWKVEWKGEERFFFWSVVNDTDGYIMTQHSGEFVVVDWNRDAKLRDFYTGIVKKLMQKLSEEKGVRLSREEIERLGKALVQGDRTEVERVMSWISGDVKRHLLQYASELVKSKVKVGYKGWEKGKLFFIGDTIDDVGVCRHFSLLITAVVQRLSALGFLLGRTYLVGIPGHIFCVHITGMGFPIILDPAQNNFFQLNEHSKEIVYYTFSLRTPPPREDLLAIEYKKVLEIVGIKVPKDVWDKVRNRVSTFIPEGLGFGRSPDYVSVSVELDREENLGKIPDVVEELLYTRFCLAQPEGAILDIIEYLLGDKKDFIPEREEITGDLGRMKGEISEIIREKIGREVEKNFLDEWDRIDMDREIDPTVRIFRILSLLHGYGIGEIAVEIYGRVLRQAGEEFKRLVEERKLDRIREAIDALVWDAEKRLKTKSKKSTEKGGVIFSLESLVVT